MLKKLELSFITGKETKKYRSVNLLLLPQYVDLVW